MYRSRPLLVQGHCTFSSTKYGLCTTSLGKLKQRLSHYAIQSPESLCSTRSTCSTKGQANDRAGSAFDAFASDQQRLGQPARSPDPGIIEEIGYTAHHEDVTHPSGRYSTKEPCREPWGYPSFNSNSYWATLSTVSKAVVKSLLADAYHSRKIPFSW
ncbi:hypothetical protein F4820DRAFT_339137 [Hypoxylon rubiginosum]|uniref:Uncharacterized protein n=1 Tax=Hypoxylon rubiginosum TaxID=110542 RepID=A0ACB9YYD7_9PEZI|nr:hypothetical protein F4820DRAFT_339137 [Hypoxylon rubiginosum]